MYHFSYPRNNLEALFQLLFHRNPPRLPHTLSGVYSLFSRAPAPPRGPSCLGQHHLNTGHCARSKQCLLGKCLFITCTRPDVSCQVYASNSKCRDSANVLCHCFNGPKVISGLEGANQNDLPVPCLDSSGFSVFIMCFLCDSPAPSISTWNQHSPV